MREEEDDEEGSGAAAGATRAADARRGSRSEGRLHLAARALPAPSAVPSPAATLATVGPRPAQLADNLIKVGCPSFTFSFSYYFVLFQKG